MAPPTPTTGTGEMIHFWCFHRGVEFRNYELGLVCSRVFRPFGPALMEILVHKVYWYVWHNIRCTGMCGTTKIASTSSLLAAWDQQKWHRRRLAQQRLGSGVFASSRSRTQNIRVGFNVSPKIATPAGECRHYVSTSNARNTSWS